MIAGFPFQITEHYVQISRDVRKYAVMARELQILHELEKIDPEDKYPFLKYEYYREYRNHIWIVFPLLWTDLYRYVKIRHASLTMDEISSIIGRVLDGLAVMKDSELVHCDLKPENIMLVDKHSLDLKLIGK